MSVRRVRVVNMIPKSMSGETNQDSEPQLTVNHENVRMMIGTAFTPDPGGGPLGPVFASLDHGETWTLDLVIPGGEPNDQSVRFGTGSALYAGVLRGDVFLRLNILRSAPYSPSTVMQTEVQRDSVDQPYVSAIRAEGKDRVFVGTNNPFTPPQSASVDHSADARTAPPPAGLSQTFVDPRPKIQDAPSIRAAPHRNGTVYAGYMGWRQNVPSLTGDVVVARDDHFATAATPFTALVDSGDGLAGVRVAESVPIPWYLFIGNERVGSSLSIAVDPSESRVVYLAWGDGPYPGSNQTLHVRRSTDRGATWSGDLLTLPNATNPALAITSDGKVGFLYQQGVTAGGSTRWETHVQITRDAWATPAEDILLANTPDDNATYVYDPYIGDYDDLQAVGHEFYGIFCAHNIPDLANFPHGVRYQRNVDFAAKQLLDVSGVTPVPNSIDPFFFHIFWHEEREEEERERGIERERLEIKGLRYEKLEIKELKLEFDGFPGRREKGDLHAASRIIRRLADQIEDLARHRPHEHHDDDDDKDRD